MTDWQVGDLAVCVDARDNPDFRPTEIKEGAIYRVAVVMPPKHCGLYPTSRAPGLLLDGVYCDCRNGFSANRFRKIRPDEPEACEEEFRILLNLSKKRVSA